jgi:hypothetical protein
MQNDWNSFREQENNAWSTVLRAGRVIARGKERVQQTNRSVQESLLVVRFSKQVCAGAALAMETLRSKPKHFERKQSAAAD